MNNMSNTLSNTFLIVGCLFLVGVAYYSYKRKKSQKTVSTEKLINNLVSNLNVEKVDKLNLADVVNYFKSLHPQKGVDTPFVATTTKNGIKSYLIAVLNEKTNKVVNAKLISPSSIDNELQKVVGNETFVVLS